jgi:hypothetical protein
VENSAGSKLIPPRRRAEQLQAKRGGFSTTTYCHLRSYVCVASVSVREHEIPKDLLLQQGRLVLALILSHAGLFVAAWLLLRMVKSLSGRLYASRLDTRFGNHGTDDPLVEPLIYEREVKKRIAVRHN